MKIIPSREALRRHLESKAASAWALGELNFALGIRELVPGDGGSRVFTDQPAPIIQPKFTIDPSAAVFTCGSCFAREIDRVLSNRGVNVLSWPGTAGLGDEIFLRYTTHAIAAEFGFALLDNYDEANIVQHGEKWADYTGHSEAPSREALLAERRRIIEVFKQSAQADVIMLTLGLVETWFDTKTRNYTNIAPWGDLRSGRFELHVTDYESNRRVLSQLVELLRAKGKPGLKIVLTVSPVPLSHTFSGQDIVVANSYSKAVLRAVAQDVAQDDALIDYFPSYEMVTLADPAAAWLADHRHVRPQYVERIMAKFMAAYMPG